MQSFVIMLFHAFLSTVIWLTDSVFLSFYAETSFTEALWAAVPAGRLALRLFIVGIIMIFGVLRVARFRSENGLIHMLSIQKKSEALRFGNEESRSKNERVLFHCLNLAAYFNMPEPERDALRTLCYCYDIGKVGLPSELMNGKNADAADRQLYNGHTTIGAEIVEQIPSLKNAAPLIRFHHEYFNGGGVYGLKGEEIPLGCRIFSVAWAYDSMVNPQKRTRTFMTDEALQELRYYEGSAFDPMVVEAFIKIMSKTTIFSGVGSREYSFGRN